MIRPGVPAPNLLPLMGREDLRAQGGVRYRSLQARSLLNRCDSPRMPFRWTVNPYRGCAMGCRYCYATYTHEFMGIATPEEFHSTVYVKRGHEARTAADLARLVRKRELIAVGTATDPYQPGEAEARVTRGFLEAVAQHRGARLGITTKGALVLRDLDLLRRISERSSLSVHVSLNSPRADLLRRIEPWAPPPEVRIEVMRRLNAAGIETWLGLAPVLPALTDGERDLDELLRRVAAAGVRRLFSQVLFLRSPTREKYLRFVEAEFPRYLEAYKSAYRGRVYLGGRYRDRIRETIARLKAKHGFVDRDDEEDDGPPKPAEQLPLW
jgi:DNA repair photolyase